MIVVTGVHRSGTSAIAMTLQALGVDFGDSDAFYAPDEWNERGYFEREDVIDLNSRLLTGFSRTRHRVPSALAQVRYLLLPSPRAVRRRSAAMSGEVAELAARLDGIAVKDPRFCLTLEAWQDHLTAVVVCLRHPAAVAASLRRRQRVPVSFGLRFWDHHAEALLRSSGESTLYLDFDTLSGDGAALELSRVLRFLALDVGLEDALAAFRREFSPALRHFGAADAALLPARTRDLWAALQSRRQSQLSP